MLPKPNGIFDEAASSEFLAREWNASVNDMRSRKAMMLHGLYLGLYGLVKYIHIPFANYLRYVVVDRFSNHINSSSIADGVTIWFPWNVKLGRDSTLNQGVIIDGFGGVDIGEGVRIAAYACINTADHRFDLPDQMIKDQGYKVASVKIEDDVWLGSGVKIGKGVTIGRGSVIGAGSVVTKSIPPNSIAVGVPCKVIGSR